MEELSSYEIIFNEDFQMKDIIGIHHFSLKDEVNIYLYHKNMIADARNLPKLISFFFITPKNNSIVMIIDGANGKEGYENIIKSIFNVQAINAELRVNQKLENNRSIVI